MLLNSSSSSDSNSLTEVPFHAVPAVSSYACGVDEDDEEKDEYRKRRQKMMCFADLFSTVDRKHVDHRLGEFLGVRSLTHDRNLLNQPVAFDELEMK